MSRLSRLGETSFNNFGTQMKIVEYKSSAKITIEFQDEYKTRIITRYDCFKDGRVSNPYDKTIYNIGYIGEGKYNRTKTPIIYQYWQKMIQRCYDAYYINKEMTYKDCFVCEEWHCLQNFGKWYEENYYECNNEKMQLDKDILCKGNKIYSPETCIFVPKRINTLFCKSDKIRGKYPIGCTVKDNKIHVRCNMCNHRKYLGYFPLNRPFQAFYTYKIFKENYIKQVADEYKDFIPKKLYEALYKWEVEIND